MTKSKKRPQPELVTDEQQRLLEIEDARLVVKFGDKRRYSDREREAICQELVAAGLDDVARRDPDRLLFGRLGLDQKTCLHGASARFDHVGLQMPLLQGVFDITLLLARTTDHANRNYLSVSIKNDAHGDRSPYCSDRPRQSLAKHNVFT